MIHCKIDKVNSYIVITQQITNNISLYNGSCNYNCAIRQGSLLISKVRILSWQIWPWFSDMSVIFSNQDSLSVESSGAVIDQLDMLAWCVCCEINDTMGGGRDTRYSPMKVELEHRQRRSSTNSWIKITCTEGKNRQIRNVLQHLGCKCLRQHSWPRADKQQRSHLFCVFVSYQWR